MTKKIFENYFKQNLKEEIKYKIRRGDTLSRIARKFGISSWRKIMKVNPQIKNANIIRAGQVINIPVSIKQTAATPQKREMRNLIDMDRVAEIGKKLSKFSVFQRQAKARGYALTFEYSLALPNAWAHMDGAIIPPTCVVRINYGMFRDYGVNKIENALNLINKIAIQLGNKPLNIEFFKPVVEEFLGAWMSTSIAHELRHASNLYFNVPISKDGSFNQGALMQYNIDAGMDPEGRNKKAGAQNRDEEEARAAEAFRTNKVDGYVYSRIAEMARRLEDAYGFSAEDQREVIGKMIEVWNDCIEETKAWFKNNKHKDLKVPKLPSSAPRGGGEKKPTKPVGGQVSFGPISTTKDLTSTNETRRTHNGETTMNKNNIIEEYILKNTSEKFEETPFGQIVADEVNYVVNNLPEIQLARDVLGEQAAVEAGTKIAQTLLRKLRAEMEAKIPALVQQEVEKMQAELADDTEKAVASIETEEPAV